MRNAGENFRVWVSSILLLLVSGAQAAPSISSRDECMVFADMALVASAMYAEGADKGLVSRVVEVVYTMSDDRQKELSALILQAASHAKEDPKTFAIRFAQTCVQKRGNVDEMLGTSL